MLTVDQIKEYANSTKNPKLLAINDLSVLVNGPVEFFQHENRAERPYSLYDPAQNKHYDGYEELQKDSSASNTTFIYNGVEQLPSELPIDASKMFSTRLSTYIPEILKATYRSQAGEGSFEEAWKDVPAEVKRGIETTLEGKVGENYDYLNKLL